MHQYQTLLSLILALTPLRMLLLQPMGSSEMLNVVVLSGEPFLSDLATIRLITRNQRLGCLFVDAANVPIEVCFTFRCGFTAGILTLVDLLPASLRQSCFKNL